MTDSDQIQIYFHNIYTYLQTHIKTRNYKNNYGGVTKGPIRPEMITPKSDKHLKNDYQKENECYNGTFSP